jgi:hypothetical protein
MAFLDDQNKDQTDTQTAGAQQGQPLAQSAPNVSGSGGGSDVGGGVSTAGIGNGGAGGWTNIQAYLNANQGDNGSAKNLSDAVSSQFSNDKTNMQNQSQTALSDAQNYVNQANVSNDQANQWITGAAGAYNWDGTTGQPQAYTDYVNKAQTALNGQYQGPSSFAYSLDPRTQNYGDSLSNDGAFKNLMTNLYSQKAGQPLTSGQADLQGQFDANNQNLASARQQGLAQYGDLQKSRDALNSDTTNALNADQTQFRTNQANLKNYLGTQGTTYAGNIQTDDANAKSGYGTDFRTQGINDSSLGRYNDWNPYALTNELNSGFASTDHGVGYRAPITNAINNFNTAENAKYANADDQDKRAFNSIQDFLGSAGGRQTQGYKVV